MNIRLYEQEKRFRDLSNEKLRTAGIDAVLAGLNGFAFLTDSVDGDLNIASMIVNGPVALGLGILAIGNLVRSNQLSNQADAILTGISTGDALKS